MLLGFKGGEKEVLARCCRRPFVRPQQTNANNWMDSRTGGEIKPISHNNNAMEDAVRAK
ncbi:hypothetical protein Syun_011769 [Stephania yunnanensis]|uniref:Uncharacterized protein n=1 Tax=Stephania yunnanensis TaxID=152371 RepID=A0AAP0JYX6_9MAGN